jgi:hypothetical protein
VEEKQEVEMRAQEERSQELVGRMMATMATMRMMAMI